MVWNYLVWIRCNELRVSHLAMSMQPLLERLATLDRHHKNDGDDNRKQLECQSMIVLFGEVASRFKNICNCVNVGQFEQVIFGMPRKQIGRHAKEANVVVFIPLEDCQ